MKTEVEILKSKNDKLLYKYIKLENDLKCVLIQDKATKESSAVLNVGVGSLEDPTDCQGLAHFLEHMLFMGILNILHSCFFCSITTSIPIII